ncbi:JAB domain-containing protein [Pseudomonas alkylphenolica]|uniref:DNA repair protein RadC n=1 Tax=Pseudomonas alkylphenolica TaxID=237609 RepID=A0A077F9Z9_9PSED|nr:DNA repair protein RadC [Pseudomonas alkylphenolica]
MSTSLAMISGNAALNPVGTPDDDQIIEQALVILEQRVFTRGPSLQSPEDVRNYLQLKIAAQPHEVFGAVFLDSKHQVLAYEPLFSGLAFSNNFDQGRQRCGDLYPWLWGPDARKKVSGPQFFWLSINRRIFFI